MGYMQMELSDTTGGEILPDSTITREFRLPREVLTPPGAQETFITEVLVTEPASDPVEDRIKFETGDYASDDYGGCIVRTLPLSVSFPDLSPDRTEDYDFLPDFGVAVFRGITEGGEVTYAVTPVSFSTEPPPL